MGSDGVIDLAIIGGSGFYDLPGLTGVEDHRIDTPFGPPSDVIRTGKLGSATVAFVARHGFDHRHLPSELPQRANFWALKSMGVQRVLGVSAVGGLQEACSPGTAVVPDQIIDRTRGVRPPSFFGEGVVAHVAMADPFCPVLRKAVVGALKATDGKTIDTGTYVVIEGPSFGTRAESELYRSWGASVVGMTAMPEARLAREAELCYALQTTVTDYDSWYASADPVDAEMVLRVLSENVERAQAAVRKLADMLPSRDACGCSSALDLALVTPPDAIPDERRRQLAPILDRRLGAGS